MLKMRSIIIAGSRSLSLSLAEIDERIARLDPSGLLWVPSEWSEIVCGMARGMDLAGLAWAESKGKSVYRDPVRPADVKLWGKYLAPKARNHRMGLRADGALIFWDKRSGGSADMAARMNMFDKPCRVIDCSRQASPAHEPARDADRAIVPRRWRRHEPRQRQP